MTPARSRTSAEDASADPRDWVLEGSPDGTTWRTLDERRDQTFRWRAQTRPFKIAGPGAYSHYRLRAGGKLSEMEVRVKPVRDLSNRAERTLDLTELRGTSRTLYLRFQDSRPDDGWGAWLARLRLDLRRL